MDFYAKYVPPRLIDAAMRNKESGRTGSHRSGSVSRGGCHLNRRIDELIWDAGFQITELSACYFPGPRPMTYTYQGFAQLV